MLDTIFNFIPFLQNVAPAWKAVTLLVSIAPAVGAMVTSGVMIWHGAVGFVTALSGMTGSQKVDHLAHWLKVESDLIDASESKVLAVINRFSAIPLPQKAAAPAAPAASPA